MKSARENQSRGPKTVTKICLQEIAIIRHVRKAPLLCREKPSVKKKNASMFDVATMDLLFILDSLANKFGKGNVGLYSDDRLALLKNTTARAGDKTNKLLRRIRSKSHCPNQPENYHFPSHNPKSYRLNNSTPADAHLSIHLQSCDKSHLPSTKNLATLLKPRILPGRSELDPNIEHLPNASSNEKPTQIAR